jgi:hypothetical protein
VNEDVRANILKVAAGVEGERITRSGTSRLAHQLRAKKRVFVPFESEPCKSAILDRIYLRTRLAHIKVDLIRTERVQPVEHESSMKAFVTPALERIRGE